MSYSTEELFARVPSLDGRLWDKGSLSDPLSRTGCPIAGEPGTRGHVHCLTEQSRSSRAERVRSFWKGRLTEGFHLCQGGSQGLSNQPCERQTRTPIHCVAQTIDEITREADSQPDRSRLLSSGHARSGRRTSGPAALIPDRVTRSGLIGQRHCTPLQVALK